MSKILTIVLNYNDYEKHTAKCLQSLHEQIGVSHDILVIDNNSHQDPGDEIARAFSRVKYIRNKSNLGVAGGRNVGIKYALNNNYDYVFVFDNDALADRFMLYRLAITLNNDHTVGICGPKILERENGTNIYRAGCTHWKLTYLHSFTEIIRRLFKIFGMELPDTLDTIRGKGKRDRGQFDTDRYVDFQLGAATLTRCNVFKEIGLLDNQFNPYGSEDIDFCVRSRKVGWKIKYVSSAVCWHPATEHAPDQYGRSYQNTKNIILLARKNLSGLYFWIVFVPDFSLLTIPLMLIECVLKKWSQRRIAILDAVKWNLNDAKKRGLLIKPQSIWK